MKEISFDEWFTGCLSFYGIVLEDKIDEEHTVEDLYRKIVPFPDIYPIFATMSTSYSNKDSLLSCWGTFYQVAEDAKANIFNN